MGHGLILILTAFVQVGDLHSERDRLRPVMVRRVSFREEKRRERIERSSRGVVDEGLS